MTASALTRVSTLPSFISLIRSMDSMTATASAWSSTPISWPVSTMPVTSEGRSTLVGRIAGSIIIAGAMEFAPESELREPINDNRLPSEPARAMPYIGLCGLLPVSLSERAGITAPLIWPLRRPAFSVMPANMALLE